MRSHPFQKSLLAGLAFLAGCGGVTTVLPTATPSPSPSPVPTPTPAPAGIPAQRAQLIGSWQGQLTYGGDFATNTGAVRLTFLADGTVSGSTVASLGGEDAQISGTVESDGSLHLLFLYKTRLHEATGSLRLPTDGDHLAGTLLWLTTGIGTGLGPLEISLTRQTSS